MKQVRALTHFAPLRWQKWEDAIFQQADGKGEDFEHNHDSDTGLKKGEKDNHLGANGRFRGFVESSGVGDGAPEHGSVTAGGGGGAPSAAPVKEAKRSSMAREMRALISVQGVGGRRGRSASVQGMEGDTTPRACAADSAPGTREIASHAMPLGSCGPSCSGDTTALHDNGAKGEDEEHELRKAGPLSANTQSQVSEGAEARSVQGSKNVTALNNLNMWREASAARRSLTTSTRQSTLKGQASKNAARENVKSRKGEPAARERAPAAQNMSRRPNVATRFSMLAEPRNIMMAHVCS